jgi:hypothetical protein
LEVGRQSEILKRGGIDEWLEVSAKNLKCAYVTYDVVNIGLITE